MERVEVITSVERRRRFSDEEKMAMLMEARRTSVARVAQKYEISPSLVYLWKKKLERDCVAVAPAPSSAFVKVASPQALPAPTVEQPIYVHLGGDVIVEFPGAVDMQSLKAFIQSLRG